MAAANAFVLLSSSPLEPIADTAQSKQNTGISSSPLLLSPSQLLSRKAYSMSSAMERNTISREAVVSFESTSGLLRRSQSADYSNRTAVNEKKVAGASPVDPSAENASVKKALQSAKDKKEPAKVKKSKASAAKATSTRRKSKDDPGPAKIDNITDAAVERPISELRDRKSKEPTQTKIKKSKVTKVGSVNGPFGDTKLKSKAKKISETDKESNESLAKAEGATPLTCSRPQDLCLDDALRRRNNWTPVKDTGNDSTTINGETAHTRAPSNEGTPATSKRINHFDNLRADYGYSHTSASAKETSEASRTSTGEALTKRRKLELIATSICPPSEPTKTKRSKSPKKKPQTITAKATAPFVNLDTTPVNNLLQYLTPDTVTELVDHEPIEGKKRRSNTKSTSKAKVTSSRKAKASRQAVTVLPPDKALKRAAEQELLFGTSSQLARDDSPTFVREIQQAMKESESMLADSPQVVGEGVTASVGSSSTNGSKLSLFAASRGLWSAATRDFYGSLQEAEVVDLSKTPRPPSSHRTTERSLQPASPIQKIQTLSKASDTIAAADGWTNVDDIASPEHQQHGTEPERTLHKSLAEAALKNRPKSRSPVKKPKVGDTQPKPPDMPNYEGFTPSELEKQLKAYHLKAPKLRKKQISLLESCWESKNRTALQSLEPNVNKPQQKADSSSGLDATAKSANASPAKRKRGRPPKQAEADITQNQTESTSKPEPELKPRGRPRKEPIEKTPSKKPAKSRAKPKNSASTSIPTAKQPSPQPAEIPDSDPDATPRPPSRPALLSLEPSDAFVTLSSPATNSAPPTPLSHTALLGRVTEAVTTFPPTHDMRNLTFYEKMLLYDPIVLEDLAAWLNTEGLKRVGVDDEVSATLVKEWCEGRSVCCLWRENLRGEARKRW